MGGLTLRMIWSVGSWRRYALFWLSSLFTRMYHLMFGGEHEINLLCLTFRLLSGINYQNALPNTVAFIEFDLKLIISCILWRAHCLATGNVFVIRNFFFWYHVFTRTHTHQAGMFFLFFLTYCQSGVVCHREQYTECPSLDNRRKAKESKNSIVFCVLQLTWHWIFLMHNKPFRPLYAQHRALPFL